MDSDEVFVLDVCDLILGEQGLRQHCFDWLRGDPNAQGSSRRLPVDAYYPKHRLVVEYHEIQHFRAVPHFDKPGRMTVSGVDRGQQRDLYDRRRATEIPAHGLRYITIPVTALACSQNGRLIREPAAVTRDLCRILDVDYVALRARLAAGQSRDSEPSSGATMRTAFVSTGSAKSLGRLASTTTHRPAIQRTPLGNLKHSHFWVWFTLTMIINLIILASCVIGIIAVWHIMHTEHPCQLMGSC